MAGKADETNEVEIAKEKLVLVACAWADNVSGYLELRRAIAEYRSAVKRMEESKGIQ
jgi:hypothetical protein